LLDLEDGSEDSVAPKQNVPETHCFDATGLKLSGPGEWLQDVHHPRDRRVWLKFHVDAIAPTHEIRVHALTGRDVGDGTMFNPLLVKAKQKGLVGKVLGDKGYDAKNHFESCAKGHVVAGILPKKNASTKSRGGPARARTVWEIQQVGLKEWKKAVGYNQQWTVERVFSIFKRVFGDKVRARTSAARVALPFYARLAFLRGRIPGAILFLLRKLKIFFTSKMPSPRARATSMLESKHSWTRGMKVAWSPTSSFVSSCARTSLVSALTDRWSFSHPRQVFVPSPHFLRNHSPELTTLRPDASTAMVRGSAGGFCGNHWRRLIFGHSLQIIEYDGAGNPANFYLEFLDTWDADLVSANKRKVGNPFTYPDAIFAVVWVLRFLFSIPYHTLEGLFRALGKEMSPRCTQRSL
jgi:hypothetical protein